MTALERIRVGAGISVHELASKAKVSPATIYSIEKGDVQRPQMATLRALADVLHTSVPDLIDARTAAA